MFRHTPCRLGAERGWGRARRAGREPTQVANLPPGGRARAITSAPHLSTGFLGTARRRRFGVRGHTLLAEVRRLHGHHRPDHVRELPVYDGTGDCASEDRSSDYPPGNDCCADDHDRAPRDRSAADHLGSPGSGRGLVTEPRLGPARNLLHGIGIRMPQGRLGNGDVLEDHVLRRERRGIFVRAGPVLEDGTWTTMPLNIAKGEPGRYKLAVDCYINYGGALFSYPDKYFTIT